MEKQTVSLLIVDDEEIIRTALMYDFDWLSLGIEVVGSAPDGKEAFDMIKSLKPDIVISDIKMPGCDGIQLSKLVYNHSLQTKIILLSGFNDFSYAQKAIQYKVNTYILKPINVEELKDAVCTLKDDILSKRKTEYNQSAFRSIQMASYRQQFLRELVTKNIGKDRIDTILPTLNIHFTSDKINVSLIKLVRLQEDTEAAADIYNQTLDNLKSLLCNDTSHVFMLTNDIIVILSHTVSTVFLEQFVLDYSVSDEISLYACKGNAVSLYNLSASYNQAKEVLEFYIYFDKPCVLSNDFLTQPLPPTHILNQLSTQEIFNSLMQNDHKQAYRNYLQCIDTIMYIPTPPPNFLFSMCNYILTSLSKELRHNNTDFVIYTWDFYYTLQNLGSIKAINKWVSQLFEILIADIGITNSKKVDPVIEKVMQYCEEHIDTKIKIEELCTFVGLSKSYFTTYFKNKTNINFRDYLLNMKINYACTALKTQDITPTELSIMIGYDDYRSFNRAFKARTATTPSEYQKKYCVL